jgi:hypothetical protein
MDSLPSSLKVTHSVLYTLCLALVFSTAYIVAVIVYRIFLHPLSTFPGPRLAAATGLWKAYFQCTKSFTHELIKLHEIYGKKTIAEHPRQSDMDCLTD